MYITDVSIHCCRGMMYILVVNNTLLQGHGVYHCCKQYIAAGGMVYITVVNNTSLQGHDIYHCCKQYIAAGV